MNINHPTTQPWDDAQDAELLKLTKQGLSPREIGEIMGRTRNSIIGRLYRLRAGSKPKGISHAPIFNKSRNNMKLESAQARTLRILEARKIFANPLTARLPLPYDEG